MVKTLEQRIAYIEKVIMDFFTGSERKAKKVASLTKRGVKRVKKSGRRKVATRKSQKKSRRA